MAKHSLSLRGFSRMAWPEKKTKGEKIIEKRDRHLPHHATTPLKIGLGNRPWGG